MNTDYIVAEAFAKALDVISYDKSKAVVPFFAESSKTIGGADGFGSGFIVKYKNNFYLLTAAHVVRESLGDDAIAIVISDKSVLLNGIGFYINEKNDTAFTIIDDLINKNGIENIHYIDIENEINGIETGYQIIMGYPGTKNRLKPKLGKTDRYLQSITVELSKKHSAVKTKIENPIYFEYIPRNLVDSQLNRANTPAHLHGMSGGPALSIHIDINNMKLSAKLSGVLVEWHDKKNVVIASSSKELLSFIKRKS